MNASVSGITGLKASNLTKLKSIVCGIKGLKASNLTKLIHIQVLAAELDYRLQISSQVLATELDRISQKFQIPQNVTKVTATGLYRRYKSNQTVIKP